MKILRYACNSCDYKSYFDQSLKTHQRINHKGQQVKVIAINCTSCQQNVEHEKHYNPDAQSQHQPTIRQNRDGKFKCQITDCFFSSNCKKSLKRHVDSLHLKLNRYTCSGCDYKTYQSHNVKSHQQTHHKGELLEVICIDCSLCQQKVQHLRHRIRRNEEDNKKSPKLVEEGKGMKTENVDSKQFTCDMDNCSFSTDNEKRLDQHTESFHLNILRYYCNVCDYKSYYNYKVAKHQEIHADTVVKVLKIGCQKCEDNIDHKSHYKAVLKKHQCKEEGCSFSTNSPKHKIVLRCHTERVHLQILRYSCNLCGQKKYYKSSIIKHQKTEHKLEESPKVLKIGTESFNQKLETTENKHQIGTIKCSNSRKERKQKDPLKSSTEECATNSEIKLKNLHENQETKKVLVIGCKSFEEKTEHSKHLEQNQEHFQHSIKETQALSRQKVGMLKCAKADCGFRTNHKQSLRQHYEAIHLQLLKYACNLCDYKSYHHFHLKDHQNSKIHKNQPMKILRIGCTLCDENLEHIKHSNDRRGHTAEPNKGRNLHFKERKERSIKLECDECGIGSFNTNKERIKHYKSEHPGKHIFNCNYCKYGSNYLANVNNHVDSMHEKKEFKCENCPYKTAWKQSFHHHMRLEHGYFQYTTKFNIKGDGQSYLCQECGYSTFSQSDFKRHKSLSACSMDKRTRILVERQGRPHLRRLPNGLKANEIIRKYKCNKCDYSTDYHSDVRKHVRAAHEPKPEVPDLKLMCDQCDYSSKFRYNLKIHIESKHTISSGFSCPECGKHAPTRNALRAHQKRNHI